MLDKFHKEATDLYQTGFVKAANSKLQQCEMHIYKSFELIAKAMHDPSMYRSIITLENSRKKIPLNIAVLALPS